MRQLTLTIFVRIFDSHHLIITHAVKETMWGVDVDRWGVVGVGGAVVNRISEAVSEDELGQRLETDVLWVQRHPLVFFIEAIHAKTALLIIKVALKGAIWVFMQRRGV
jgi:hypothetical protein